MPKDSPNSSDSYSMNRRRVLSTAGASLLLGLAGCSTDSGSDGENGDGGSSGSGSGGSDGSSGSDGGDGGSGTDGGSTSSGDNIIKVGQATPLTGSSRVYGLPHSAGHEIAAKQINENGGIEVDGTSYEVEFIVRDSEATPSVAQNAATQLIQEENVDVLISGNIPTAVLSYTDLVQETETFLLNDGNESIDLHFMDYDPMFSPYTVIWSENYPNLSRLYPMGTYTVNDLEYSNVAFLTPNLAYGKQAEQYISQAVEDAGGTVAARVQVPAGTSDFTNAITRLQSAGADAIIATVFPNSFFQFLEQAGQQGLRDQSQIITAQAPSEEVAANLVSPDVADDFIGYGMTYPTAKLAVEEGILAPEPFERRSYVKEQFSEQFPDRTFTYIATKAYEGMNLLQYAIESGGGFDNDSLITGFEEMTYSDISDFTTQYYVPPNGSVSDQSRTGAIFDEDHQAYYENSVQRWNQGKKEFTDMIRVGDYW